MFSRVVFRQILAKPIREGLHNSYLLKNVAKMSTNSPTFECLSVSELKEFVFHVELNRPDKLNALNKTMFREIKDCFEFLSDSEDCRVVVLSAAGRLFTAGLDLKNLISIPEVEDVARRAKLVHQALTSFQESMSSLELCKKPVISAIHGGCVGAGVSLVTAADIRYCTNDAYFTIKEVDVGLAADIGALQRLPKIVGSDSLAREISYTGRKIPATEALSSGLVSKVYDNKEEMIKGVTELAEEIAKKSPVAVQTTKASLVYSRDHGVQEGLDQVAWLNQLMLQSEDLANAAMAQLTKNPDVKFSKL